MLLPMLVEDARLKAHPTKDEAKRSLLSQLSFARRFARDQEGSFTIFSLFIFVLIILIGGMAVDLMRFETRRTALQNTVDSAVLAAANLDQTIEAETLIKSFFEKSGFDPDLVTVPEPEIDVIGADEDGTGGTLVGRTVEADVDLSVDTYFMHMMGIDSLETVTASSASESIQNVEISLVVDISGSMSGTKMNTLKTEAKKFFREVIDEESDLQSTTISIIPYNHTVVAGAELLNRLNVIGGTGLVIEPEEYPGSLLTYPISHNDSHCIRFDDDAFEHDNLEVEYAGLRAIVPPMFNGGVPVPGTGTPLTRQGHFDNGGNSFNKPTMSQRECDNTRTPILVHESRLAVLDAHINRLIASGNTAIDNGMKWAVALLDPAMRPVVEDMIEEDLIPDVADNRPGEYDSDETMKVVVLMTDGQNTRQLGLKDQYLNGPSRIWYSAKAADQDEADYIVDANKNGWADREKEWYDGYYVLMPNRPENRRWMRPHVPGNYSDGVDYAEDELPDDAVQLHHVELYERFAENDIAEFFFRNEDNTTRNQYRNAVHQTVNTSALNRRLKELCEAARVNNDILIFTIAFSAPEAGRTAMLNCATAPGYYYNATPESLAKAFDSIAASITQLRLTQ
ncbi:MAG: TadE/TadG family type IV pilus assembly protein [Pseudomonadota bacterium]